jgi:hypothetical protein
MQLHIRKQIGERSYTFTFEGQTLHDVVLASQHLGFQDVDKCGQCNSSRLYLRAYVTEKDKYKYVKVVCAGCSAQLTFGVAKKDGAFFLRRREDKTLAWEAAPTEEVEA